MCFSRQSRSWARAITVGLVQLFAWQPGQPSSPSRSGSRGKPLHELASTARPVAIAAHHRRSEIRRDERIVSAPLLREERGLGTQGYNRGPDPYSWETCSNHPGRELLSAFPLRKMSREV